jgi:uncharacterized membrane protein YfcA
MTLNAILQTTLLVVSAFAAGVVNTIAGGGTLLTFPSLMRFGHLSEVLANGTSTVALLPGSLAGTWGLRREMKGVGSWLLLLSGPSLVGGVAGSLLVTRLPPTYFAALVPWLLLTASLLFLAQPRLAKRFPPRGDGHLPSWRGCVVVVLFQFLVAVYGGYFGAGIGILMITSLSLMGLGEIQRINGVKTLLASFINGVSVVVFVMDGAVEWRFAPPMAVGAIAGGYAGAVVGRRLPRQWVRRFVIAIGLALAAYYFAKQWGLLSGEA